MSEKCDNYPVGIVDRLRDFMVSGQFLDLEKSVIT